MATDFRPGDRVSARNGAEWTIGDIDVADARRIHYGTKIIVRGLEQYSTPPDPLTITRPVYPKPGQVVIALDADDVSALEAIRAHRYRTFQATLGQDAAAFRLDAILDRARDAS